MNQRKVVVDGIKYLVEYNQTELAIKDPATGWSVDVPLPGKTTDLTMALCVVNGADMSGMLHGTYSHTSLYIIEKALLKWAKVVINDAVSTLRSDNSLIT